MTDYKNYKYAVTVIDYTGTSKILHFFKDYDSAVDYAIKVEFPKIIQRAIFHRFPLTPEAMEQLR